MRVGRVGGALAHHVSERLDARARGSAGGALGARRPTLGAPGAATVDAASLAVAQRIYAGARAGRRGARARQADDDQQHDYETMRQAPSIPRLFPRGQREALSEVEWRSATRAGHTCALDMHTASIG